VTEPLKVVYIVLKNADFTEGRGPMLLHTVFSDGEEAIKYVEKQKGIFGSPQNVERGKGSYARANGYEIVEHDVFQSADDLLDRAIAFEREAALGKLTLRERRLLGLMT